MTYIAPTQDLLLALDGGRLLVVHLLLQPLQEHRLRWKGAARADTERRWA